MAVSKVILNGQTIMDATQTTVTVDTLVESYTALNKAGTVITGAMPNGDSLTYGAAAGAASTSSKVNVGTVGSMQVKG